MSEEDFDNILEMKFAEYRLNKHNMKQRMMGSLANYFVYERYGRELFMWDYNMGAIDKSPNAIIIYSI